MSGASVPRVKFWGVRGSVPTPGSATARYGGNTACVEVRSATGESLIIDAGTGLCALGRGLAAGAAARGPRHVLLSHFHWDHIQGIPFFQPLYDADAEVVFHAPGVNGDPRTVLKGQMRGPYFPLGFADLPSRPRVKVLDSRAFAIGAFRVTPFPLRHPQGATGFRVEIDGGSMVYASDREHGDPDLDAALAEVSRGADLLVHDCNYTPEEYESRVGWGHSHWAEAVRVAEEAGVERLVVFHHDPGHDDDFLDDLAETVARRFSGAVVARDGLEMDLSGSRPDAGK